MTAPRTEGRGPLRVKHVTAPADLTIEQDETNPSVIYIEIDGGWDASGGLEMSRDELRALCMDILEQLETP